jgi:pimeloyl-ACP methyl ester carboxylesterase
MVTTGAKFNPADAVIGRHRSPVHMARIALILLTGCMAVPASAWASDPGRLYDVHGTKLYVEVLGSGPPIVFLHGGLSFFDRSFTYQKAYFATFRTVIGIDQSGHGHSPDYAQPFSYRAMAEDTAAVLQQLHLGSADIVGHSDGGNVALLLARYHPDLVRRVVVSGANFRGDFAGLLAYARLRWWTSEQHFADSVSVTARHDYDAVSPYGDRHWDVVLTKTKDLWTTWTVISQEDLRAIHAPVLIMAGDHDVISLEHTIALYRSLPTARLCILPNTGHDTMAERPSLFNDLTRAFLAEDGPR